MTAQRRRVLDVGALPAHAFGHRDPLWWAVILLVCIEGTMLVLLALSYFYLRGHMTPWPVTPIPRSLAWLGTAELALWWISAVPMHCASNAAIRGSLRGMRGGLILATVPAVIALGCRYWIMDHLPFRWDADAYASTVWTLLAAQWVHGLTGAGENVLYIALLYRGPVEDKHRVDIEVSTPLWYFVLAGALLIWLVLFAAPLVGGDA
jgi:heme/copper-type cytochrome/quinol oxidase subunit 3